MQVLQELSLAARPGHKKKALQGIKPGSAFALTFNLNIEELTIRIINRYKIIHFALYV